MAIPDDRSEATIAIVTLINSFNSPLEREENGSLFDHSISMSSLVLVADGVSRCLDIFSFSIFVISNLDLGSFVDSHLVSFEVKIKSILGGINRSGNCRETIAKCGISGFRRGTRRNI